MLSEMGATHGNNVTKDMGVEKKLNAIDEENRTGVKTIERSKNEYPWTNDVSPTSKKHIKKNQNLKMKEN